MNFQDPGSRFTTSTLPTSWWFSAAGGLNGAKTWRLRLHQTAAVWSPSLDTILVPAAGALAHPPSRRGREDGRQRTAALHEGGSQTPRRAPTDALVLLENCHQASVTPT